MNRSANRCVIAWATLSSTFPHEPKDVQMKRTSTVFCPHLAHKAPNQHMLNGMLLV